MAGRGIPVYSLLIGFCLTIGDAVCRDFFGAEFMKIVVLLFGITFMWAAFGGACVTAASTARPNILFIMSDDHAYQAISTYGSKLCSTPNIDRIAKEGMRFDRCCVTNSICGPSRACLLTGKYSHKNGYYSNESQFDVDQPTFPKMMQKAGYQTALIGKWHLGTKKPPTGFDHWIVFHNQGLYYQPRMITRLGEINLVGYATELVTSQTLAWLKNGRDPQKPFMVMMHHKAPHRPWDPSPKYQDKFADANFPEPPTLFDDYKNRASAAANAEMRIADHMNITGPDLKAWDQPRLNTRQNMQERNWFYNQLTVRQQKAWKKSYDQKNRLFYQGGLTGKELTRWKYQRYLQDYLSCVASVDDSVGEVLKYLDDAGLAENTIVVYCSDQGFYLGEHGWFDKRFMYEESLRTPLVIRWPGVIKAGVVDNHIVSNVDFAETFLDAAGIEIPADMQGQSLVPLLAGEEPGDWRDSFYYHYYEGATGVHAVAEHYGVTTGKHKLIHYHKLGEWELFDLENDPQELKSVYNDVAYKDVQANLMAELTKLRAKLGVTSNDPTEGRN